MATCHACGEDAAPGARYCLRCGARFDDQGRLPRYAAILLSPVVACAAFVVAVFGLSDCDCGYSVPVIVGAGVGVGLATAGWFVWFTWLRHR